MNQIYEKYRRQVLHEPDKEAMGIETIVSTESLKICKFTAILYVLLNAYYLVSDLRKGFYEQPNTKMNMVALLIMIVVSVLVIIVAGKRNTSLHCKRYTMLLYYIGINVAVVLFSYTMNNRAATSGIDVAMVGISLSTVYLLTFLLAPLYRKADSNFIMLLMFAGMVALMLAPGHEGFDVFKQLSFRVVIFLGYCYQRKRAGQSAEREVRNVVLNRQLMEYSYVDHLTGALNRNAMSTYITELEKSGECVSSIMMDVDHFKAYNDAYSHKTGDEVLRKMAEAVLSTLGEADPYLFRFGGEEFVVLVHARTEEELIATAQKYRAAVKALSFPTGDGEKGLTITIGCFYPGEEKCRIRQRIDFADEQMYYGKQNGRDCVVFRNEIIR